MFSKLTCQQGGCGAVIDVFIRTYSNHDQHYWLYTYLKKIAQDPPSHPWKSISPRVVFAWKLGAVEPSRSAGMMVCSWCPAEMVSVFERFADGSCRSDDVLGAAFFDEASVCWLRLTEVEEC